MRKLIKKEIYYPPKSIFEYEINSKTRNGKKLSITIKIIHIARMSYGLMDEI